MRIGARPGGRTIAISPAAPFSPVPVLSPTRQVRWEARPDAFGASGISFQPLYQLAWEVARQSIAEEQDFQVRDHRARRGGVSRITFHGGIQ